MRELIEDIRQIERAFAARLIAPAIEALKAALRQPRGDAPISTSRRSTC